MTARPQALRALFWIAAILFGLPILVVGLVLVLLTTDQPPFLPEPSPCDEALRHVGIATLPAGATQLDCQAGGFQESVVNATLTATPGAIEQWIASELPGTVLGTDGCGDADRCARVEPNTPDSSLTPSWALEIDINDVNDGEVSVKIRAFTT